MDLLEGFFPNREDIYNLTNRGIMHPDFITQDHNEAIEQQHQRKKSVMDELNAKLDPTKRPSIVQLSDKGLIPENWLLDLYGLADEVRKKHRKMESAVLDLKSQLNVPPILADVVARDVLDEIETVDPYLLQSDDKGNHNNNDNEDEDEEDDDDIDQDDDITGGLMRIREKGTGRRGSNDNNRIDINKIRQEYENQIYELKKQIEEHKQEMSSKNKKIQILENKNKTLEESIEEQKLSESEYLAKIHRLEHKQSLIKDQTNEISRLREEQNSIELHRLDYKAMEMDLSKERLSTQRLRDEKNSMENELLHYKYKCSEYENVIQQFEREKISLIQNTSKQIN